MAALTDYEKISLAIGTKRMIGRKRLGPSEIEQQQEQARIEKTNRQLRKFKEYAIENESRMDMHEEMFDLLKERIRILEADNEDLTDKTEQLRDDLNELTKEYNELRDAFHHLPDVVVPLKKDNWNRHDEEEIGG